MDNVNSEFIIHGCSMMTGQCILEAGIHSACD